jgi:hypothetical protein
MTTRKGEPLYHRNNLHVIEEKFLQEEILNIVLLSPV